MAGVSGSIVFNLVATLAGAAVAGEAPRYRADFERRVDIAPGTDALGKCDLLYSATRTIAASGNEDLDFAGVLAGPLGATIAAAEIVAVVIEAAAGNTNDVVYGPTASVGALGPFGDLTDRLKVRAGDFQVLYCRTGWTITATTADKWNVANSGGTTGVTYTIHVIARSVAA